MSDEMEKLALRCEAAVGPDREAALRSRAKR